MYPAYRKYKDRDVWFEIVSPDLFFEVNKIGEKYLLTETKAIQFPEKLRITDMMDCLDGAWEKIPQETYSEILEKVKF
ncbi:MAG: hypothetical protein ABJG68_10125 [Crocinitomicaceae bacterium]